MLEWGSRRFACLATPAGSSMPAHSLTERNVLFEGKISHAL